MNSLLKSKPKSSTKKVFSIVSLCCAFFIGIQFFFPRFFIGTAQMVARPLWFLRDGTSSSVMGFFGYFARVSSLRTENESLRDQLYALKVKESEFNQMKTEYTNLKALVKATSTPPTRVARVLSKPPFTPYDTFVVDKGSNAGVQMGDLVYANDALVIGRITTVTRQTSSVTLFSSGEQVQEFEVTRTGVSASVYGKGGGNFELYVPKDFDIVVGDTLAEPASEAGIVASVYVVDQTSQNSFKRVYARVPQAIFQAKFVVIGNI